MAFFGKTARVTYNKFIHPAIALRNRLPAIPSILVPRPKNAPARPITANPDVANMFNKHPYLRLIREDAFVGQTASDKLAAHMKEVGVVLNGLASRGVKVPVHILKDIAMMTDGTKGQTVRSTYLSLASIYAYLYGFRIMGAVGVIGLPHVTIVPMMLNVFAAGALLWGEGGSRIPGALGFQHVLLKAIARGPKFYETTPEEKKKAAGMDFNPDNNIPFELYKNSPKCMTVLYISPEKDVLLRALYGHFLIENARQMMVVECGSTRPKKVFEKNQKNVSDWIRQMRLSIVTTRRAGRKSHDSVDKQADDLLIVLEGIKKSYEKKGEAYLRLAGYKANMRRQGKAAALDAYLGDQLKKHAEMWQKKIDALKNKQTELKSRPEDMQKYIDSFYGYLGHRFRYKIVLNFRSYKTADMKLFNDQLPKVTSYLTAALQKIGGTLSSPINADILQNIVEAVKVENVRVKRPLSKAFQAISKYAGFNYPVMVQNIAQNLAAGGCGMGNPITAGTIQKVIKAVESECRTKGRKLGRPFQAISKIINGIDPTRDISGDVQKMISGGEATGDVLHRILNDYKIIDGARNISIKERDVSQYLTDRSVDMKSPITKDILKAMIDGMKINIEAIKKDEIEREWSVIEALIRGTQTGTVVEKVLMKDADGLEKKVFGLVMKKQALTKDVLAHVLMEQLSREPYRGGIKAGARSDFYGRLGKTLVKTETMFGSEVDMKAEEWDEQAKKIDSFKMKKNSKIIWPDPDYIGSYDKDYVPLSIDLLSGEYTDIFRYNLPMFKKLSKGKEGNVNTSLIQDLQINANYQNEGPKDKNGNRIFMEDPLELVAGICGADQDLWYGALKLSKALIGILNGYYSKDRTNREFLEKAAKKVLVHFVGLQGRREAKDLIAHVTDKMGDQTLNKKLDKTTGNEIIGWIQKYANEKVMATGILPGRGEFGGVFSCGTCEAEYRVGMMLGFNRPYIQTVDGKTLAQAEIRMNPDTRRMEIYNVENRFSREDKYGATESFFLERLSRHEMTPSEIAHVKRMYPQNDVKVVDGRIHVMDKGKKVPKKVIWWYDQSPTFKQITDRHKKWIFTVSSDGKGLTVQNPKSDADKFTYYPANLTMKEIQGMYEGWKINIHGNVVEGVHPKDPNKKFKYTLKPDTFWYDNMFKNCRQMEMDYSKYDDDNERTVVRDYAADGSFYETKLVTGVVKEETVYATQENAQKVLNNLYATREIVEMGLPVINPDDMNEVIIRFKTRLPEIKTVFHNGLFSEAVQTPPVYQPDKWITEDMATSYWQLYFTGWESEIMPVEVGRAVGPAYVKELLTMWRRWFKGGPEVNKDVIEELKMNGIHVAVDGIHIPIKGLDEFKIGSSPSGWMRNLARKWPYHTVTDLALYFVPPAFLAGLAIPWLPEGINPLVSPESYIAVFGGYLGFSLYAYISPMRKLGYSYKDIWYKEAMLKIAAPAYIDAWFMAMDRQPLTWDRTEAGDREMVPLNYLNAITWRKWVSWGTALWGMGATVAMLFSLHPQNIPGLAGKMSALLFNWGFGLLNAKLIDSGINRFFGFWTSFDELATYNCELAGMSRKDNAINISEDRANPDQRVVTYYANDEKQAWKAFLNITGTTAGAYLARSANATLGNVLKIVRGMGGGAWRAITGRPKYEQKRFVENFTQFKAEVKDRAGNPIYANRRARSFNGLHGKVREDFIKYLTVTGKLKKNNNVIFQVNDSARLVRGTKPNYDPQTHKMTFRVEINPKAKNYRYDNFEKHVWVPGGVYFSGDKKILRRQKKEKESK
jgi:hypothetical protein